MGALRYIYYRLVKFYKEKFHIEESPGFLIQNCYSWGLLILLTAICFYLLSIEAIVLWCVGIKMKKAFVIITFLPFIILHVFSEEIFGNEKEKYKELCRRYKIDNYEWINGFCILIFILLSIPCLITTLLLFK